MARSRAASALRGTGRRPLRAAEAGERHDHARRDRRQRAGARRRWSSRATASSRCCRPISSTIRSPRASAPTCRSCKLREENGFLPDLDEMRRLVDARHQADRHQQPEQPDRLADGPRAAWSRSPRSPRACGAWVLCDEVYRGTDQDGRRHDRLDRRSLRERHQHRQHVEEPIRSPACGWAGSPAPEELIHAVSVHRDYNTISVGMLDDHFAAIALENRDKILERNRAIVREQPRDPRPTGSTAEPLISWVKPKSGTIALLKYDLPICVARLLRPAAGGRQA